MEMKIYEKLGVRQWKKIVLWLMSKIIRNPKDRHGSNYYLAGTNVKAVKKFKKWLWCNGIIHAIGIIQCICKIICYALKSNLISSFTFVAIVFLFLNLYCVMLQRYNWLRIKKVLSKVALK